MTNLETDGVFAKRMVALAKSPNKLHQKVIGNKWDKKRTVWKIMIKSEMPDNGRVPNSPSESYTREHQTDDGI